MRNWKEEKSGKEKSAAWRRDKSKSPRSIGTEKSRKRHKRKPQMQIGGRIKRSDRYKMA